MHYLRRFVAVLAGLVVAVAAATPASATPPEIVTHIDEGLFGLPDINCGTFTLDYTLMSERVTEATHFDASGTPVRVQLTVNVVGTFTNTATGERFRDHGAHLVQIDATSGALTQSGLVFIYHRHPGGLVFLDAGRIILDAEGNVVFKAGPDDFVQTGFDEDALADALCDVLG